VNKREFDGWITRLPMNRLPVNSSVLRSVGYDGPTATLEVEFHNGPVYEYRNVPADVYAGLMSATSKGHYFDATIRTSYDCRRVF
jgi:hypothetical protein